MNKKTRGHSPARRHAKIAKTTRHAGKRAPNRGNPGSGNATRAGELPGGGRERPTGEGQHPRDHLPCHPRASRRGILARGPPRPASASCWRTGHYSCC
ncbi:MAG: hypothetical protein LBD64_07155 [Odoribacteraceae bacterium]|nr:hypothetical protein [Odoribacteraceae bacterium]